MKNQPRGRREAAAEGETAGWRHQLGGRECEQTLGDSGGAEEPSGLKSMGSQVSEP